MLPAVQSLAIYFEAQQMQTVTVQMWWNYTCHDIDHWHPCEAC